MTNQRTLTIGVRGPVRHPACDLAQIISSFISDCCVDRKTELRGDERSFIKRFIDREARFIWIDKPSDCPARATGFDFDGADFTHVGNRVTFEVLLTAFGLDADRPLSRLALAVHYLDTGGIPVEDAGGLNTILLGARNRSRTDDQLLAETMKIFDFVYSAYKDEKSADL